MAPPKQFCLVSLPTHFLFLTSLCTTKNHNKKTSDPPAPCAFLPRRVLKPQKRIRSVDTEIPQTPCGSPGIVKLGTTMDGEADFATASPADVEDEVENDFGPSHTPVPNKEPSQLARRACDVCNKRVSILLCLLFAAQSPKKRVTPRLDARII